MIAEATPANTVHPAQWHTVPESPPGQRRRGTSARKCPVCGCPRKALSERLRQSHRAAWQAAGDPAEWKWVVRARSGSLHGIAADGSRVRENQEPPERIARRLSQAAAPAAFGVPLATIARQLGIQPDTLHRSVRRYPTRWQAELERARAAGQSALQRPLEPERKEEIPAEVRDGIEKATAAIAAGLSAAEISSAHGLLPHAIAHFQEKYPDLWQSELARALEAIPQPAAFVETEGRPE